MALFWLAPLAWIVGGLVVLAVDRALAPPRMVFVKVPVPVVVEVRQQADPRPQASGPIERGDLVDLRDTPVHGIVHVAENDRVWCRPVKLLGSLGAYEVLGPVRAYAAERVSLTAKDFCPVPENDA